MKILMLFPGMINHLPPLMTAAACMSDLSAQVYTVGVGCAEESKEYLLKHNVHCIDLGYNNYPVTLAEKALLRLKFELKLWKKIVTIKPDVIWYHGGHGMAYHFLLPIKQNMIIVAHAHEYYNKHDNLGRIQNAVVRRADLYIVPESYRGWLIKGDSGTTAPFRVIPNRLSDDALPDKNFESKTIKMFRQRGGSPYCDKFIIYQGLIDSERCIKEAIHAFRMLSDSNLGFIIMGSASDRVYYSEIKNLAREDKRIVFLPSISAPGHLRITKGCIGGLILYAPTCLNNIYCAPNKIYEYAYFGLGMIMPDYPGLSSINNQFNLGTTCNPLEPNSILSAIKALLQRDKSSYESATTKFLAYSPKPIEIYKEVFNALKKKLRLCE